MGWIAVFVVGVLACVVLYASDQPNHRRKKKRLSYEGPERRSSCEDQDFLHSPAFSSLKPKNGDTVETSPSTEEKSSTS